MHTEDWREFARALKWSGFVFLIVFGIAFAMMAWIDRAHGHDWKRPDLDGWYGSLRNPHSSNSAIAHIGCCSKQDCHETEAEMRGNDWWARLGNRRYAGNGQVEADWDLQDWVLVPAEAVLLNQSNPTGSAVICHEVDLMQGSSRVDPKSRVWCFIPPTES